MNNDQIESPVDNQTYNLLQILTSKLEAVEAYSIYEEDMSGEAAELLVQMANDEKKHVKELLRLLGIQTRS